MSCTNCYNGCVETTSDKCVRYTGDNSEALNINTGDSLYVVEEALINAVVSFLDGTGIKITIDPAAYCELVTKYLPACVPICEPPTAVQLFEALVKAACDLQAQVDVLADDIATLNADYDVDCLSGVTNSSDTHDVLQAVITKLCELGVDLSALALDVDTNYVKLSDLDALIAAYLASQPVSDQYYSKMIPYTAVEYYGPLSPYFDITGAGQAAHGFDKIYLCNGLNGTPDKRGRVPVGAIVGVGGGAMNAAVDPASDPAFNYNYAVNDTYGSNSASLNVTQIPPHTHTPNVTVVDPGHTHTVSVGGFDANVDGPSGSQLQVSGGTATNITTSSNTTGITVAVTNASTGGGLPHNNTQPVLACYYIMYIP